MAFQPDRPIRIELTIPVAQPALLEGLDVWLRLGLLSDSQVKRLCRERLVCPLPQAIAAETVPIPLEEASLASQASPMLPVFINTDPETAPTANRQPSNFVTSMVQSFMAEISVIWLLFLGVFMVVVSSGVLAASQWQHFPPTEQYGILFGYTLAFWGASAWTGRQQSLRLTARMLQITTLLIVPVNFWMIDGFKLWSSGLGQVVAAIAALVLTAIAIILLKPTTHSTGVWLTLINSICLSWLQWGWGWAGFPLIATYIGTVGTALVFYHNQGNVLPAAADEEESRKELPLGTISVTFATFLLIARAVFVAHVPIQQLGLALGICGWLLCWLSRHPARQPWTRAGAVLLLAGWSIAVTAVTPWQAIAVSGLGAWLLADRLLRLQQVQDVTALFLVGLQTCWLLWRTVPTGLQQRLIAFCLSIAGTTFMPWALVGVALFPYVVLTLLFASRLRRWQQPKLAVRVEFLSLTLGIILTLLSVANPSVRSLNLLLSALTLAVITRNRSNLGSWLIYLTHVAGLAAVASGIELFFPNLAPKAWAGILLGGMVAEWGFSVGSNWLLWRRSAWHFGLVMAALSYTLLFSDLNDSTSNLMWLATPVTLSWLASRRHFSYSQLAAWLSVAALGIVQPLTLGLATPRLLGLGIATALMLFNTQRLQHLAAATLTVGFGLSFTGAVIWQLAGQVTPGWGINLLAIAALALWLLQSWLRRGNTALAEIYAAATDGWAIAVGGLNLILLTAYDLNVYVTPVQVSWKFILAAALMTSAIGYRNWQQSSNLGFYSLAWGLELLVAGAIALTGKSLTGLAIAEFVLGLTAQLVGDWWTRRRSRTPFSWHVIPLICAGLELVLSHTTFTASTGLYTLGSALIGIGVGRRHSSFKPLTYLAVFGVSAAAYELLIYSLLQTKGEGAGDGILLMAMLGIAIAVSVRLLSGWLVSYLRLTKRELKAIAHFHWFGSSGLLLLALLSSLSPSGELLWIAVAAVVAAYALVQGRSNEIWTYAGIFEATGAVGYLLHRNVSDSILVGWAAVIACVFAYGMAVLPWEAWGWSAKPWRRSATVLPGAIVLITSWGIALQSLLIVAAFYAWRATKTGIRLSYISMVLTDWAILRLLNERGVTEPLWYATLLGGSLLYVAQVDPYLRSQPEREKRHLLRSLATGLICFTALYQSEDKFLLGLLTIGLSIVVILAGLALRTRAFLYVGTATFVIKVLRQLWLFINDYSLLLWAIGIVIGLAFIWIAATFEARRSQVTALVQYWMTELEAWE